MEIRWKYRGNIMDISWKYHGNIMEVSWKYYGNIMEISWKYHGNTMENMERSRTPFRPYGTRYHEQYGELTF